MDRIPYTIVGQDLQEELAPNGQFVDMWRITFTAPSGVTAFVRVPASQHDPATVDAVIQARLQNIEGVAALGSTGTP